MRCTLRFKIFAVMIGMAGLSCAPTAQAQAPITPPTQPAFDPAEVAFQGWFFTREAETLMKAGRHAEALEKLRSAQKFFQTVNKFHPEWRKEMVTGRLDITTKDIADMQKRVDHDLYYIHRWNLFFDIQIVLQTVINVIRGDQNAY